MKRTSTQKSNWEGLQGPSKCSCPTSIPKPEPAPLLAVDLASSGASRGHPWFAPVNPSVSAHPSIEPTAGVVDLVNPALKGHDSEKIYTGTHDPVKPGAEAARTERTGPSTSPHPRR